MMRVGRAGWYPVQYDGIIVSAKCRVEVVVVVTGGLCLDNSLQQDTVASPGNLSKYEI